MGVESSLQNYLNQESIKNKIKNSSNPYRMKESLIEAFKRKVDAGKIIITKGGGYTASKESKKKADEIFGKKRKQFGFNPTGKKEGGTVSKYSTGGGVRKSKYSL